jgi:hypothetical protein
MSVSDRLLPYYAQSLHNHEPSRSFSRFNKNYHNLFDLHENKEADVSVAPGAPLQLVTKWQSDRDPMFAFQLLHQATVGTKSEFAVDGVLYSFSESKLGNVMYPIVQLECAGGITKNNGMN